MRGRVGSKGELFIPKTIRELLDLNPGDEVEYIVSNGKLIIKKIPRFIDALKNSKPKIRISIDEFEKLSEELEQELL